MSRRSVVLVAPLVPGPQADANVALSVAANKWISQLCEALSLHGVDVSLIHYSPYRGFPLGPFYASPPDRSLNLGIHRSYPIGYLNVPFLKKLSLLVSIICRLIIVVLRERFWLVVFYNAPVAHRWAAQFLSFCVPRYKGGRTVLVHADGVFRKGFGSYIFLSHYLFKLNLAPKSFHFFGGVEERASHPGFLKSLIPRGSNINDAQLVVVYSGVLNEWGGIFSACRFFSKLEDSRFVLHVYGSGEAEPLRRMFGKYANIKIFGFVSVDQLRLALENAFAFINPRPYLTLEENGNFPSKLLMYLSYGKPVLSTPVPSCSPSFKSVLTVYSDERELFERLEELCDTDHYRQVCLKVNKFRTQQTWSNNTNRLLQDLNEAIGSL